MEKKSKQSWKQNPDAVREDILRVSSSLFAKNGLSGTRVEEIAALTKTSKRMIYYYYGDKNSLYLQVLERAYTEVRDGELALDLEGFEPIEALKRLVEFTFDHHRSHPEFIRLVMIENIQGAENLKMSSKILSLKQLALDRLRDIIERGQKQGVFRDQIDFVALHWHISAVSFFNVSNQSSFAAIFGDKIYLENGQIELRQQCADAIVAYVRKNT